jgi:hypothetical protein
MSACVAAAGHASANPFLPLRVLGQTVNSSTGNRYLLTSMTTFPAAHSFAVDQGGWLWAVNDRQEMDFVIDAFLPTILDYGRSFQPPPGFGSVAPDDIDIYIGFTDSELFGASEGNWQWINGDPVTFTNWSGGEPNNVGQESDPAGEDYGEIWNLSGNRTWNDDNDRGSGLNDLPPSSPARLPAGGNVAVIELPPVPPALHLQVDPSTGYARVVSVVSAPLNLHSYSITTAAPLLTPAAWQSTNLSARGVDAPAAPAAPGNRWEVVNAAPEQIFEAFLLGGTAIASQASLVLGRIVAPFDPASAPAFVFDFASTDAKNTSLFPTAAAPVEFVAFEVPSLLAGDFDGNGAVNGADLVVWQNGFGTASGASSAAGDANGDGAVDGRDFLRWQAQFGAAAAAAAVATSVPEPAAAALLAIGWWPLARGLRRPVRRRLLRSPALPAAGPRE